MSKVPSLFICILALIFFQAKNIANALDESKFSIPKRFLGNNESVFSQFSDLINKYHPISLGSGFPDHAPPKILQEALANASLSGYYSLSQYTNDLGQPRMANATAKFFSKFFNQTLDPSKNVIITVGATQALFSAIQTHTSPGDEWIIIEPYYEYYDQMVKAASGIARFVALKPKKFTSSTSSKDWIFDREEMTKAFNNKTKGIFINTPHNPTGKVFTYEELSFIADLAKKWNTLVLSDEVYQFMVFDQNKHIRIATLPGMFERTITVGSGGKMFSATGYRIGWAIGGAQVMNNLQFIQCLSVLTVPTPIQEAFAVTFENEIDNFGSSSSYLTNFRKTQETQRNYLVQILNEFGMHTTVSQGSYFVIANCTTLQANITREIDTYRDNSYVKWMIQNVKVEGLPVSSFYSKSSKHVQDDMIRFTFIKKLETLENVEQQFLDWKSQQ